MILAAELLSIAPMLSRTRLALPLGRDARTSAITLSTSARSSASSRGCETSGIMISGFTATPASATSQAASMIARACIR